MRWPKCVGGETASSPARTVENASTDNKSQNPQRPLVNILSIFGGENSLRKKGVGGKRENLEEGEIAKRQTGDDEGMARTVRAHVRTTTPHTTQPTFPAYPPPLSAAYHFFAFHRLLSSLESFHPPEIEKNLGGAEIGWGAGTGIGGIPVDWHWNWALELVEFQSIGRGAEIGWGAGTGIGEIPVDWHWNWALELVEFQSIGTGIV